MNGPLLVCEGQADESENKHLLNYGEVWWKIQLCSWKSPSPYSKHFLYRFNHYVKTPQSPFLDSSYSILKMAVIQELSGRKSPFLQLFFIFSNWKITWDRPRKCEMAEQCEFFFWEALFIANVLGRLIFTLKQDSINHTTKNKNNIFLKAQPI